MKVLVTHAGRHGDILWAMATVRAIAETIGGPVSVMLSAKYGSLTGLIEKQPYIRAAFREPAWKVEETAPISPAVPLQVPEVYDKVIHLSLTGWPTEPTLAESSWKRAQEQLPDLKPLDLETPWIQVDSPMHCSVAVGFSDEWFELKYGVLQLATMEGALRSYLTLAAPGSRWALEARVPSMSWEMQAIVIGRTDLFFGCLSAQWVLANALGKRTVIMEPSEPRWNPVFWLDHPRNTIVRGIDGRPSFDARAVCKALREAAR